MSRIQPDHDRARNAIERLEFDEAGASLTFTRRLARENGWSLDFAGRAVAEYKPFLILATLELFLFRRNRLDR